uniref:Uncharacterized protein n=1 Tax=Arundo donax TaxID=35708 RepID=A0A0A8ZJ11_ARUDO
MPSVAVQPQEHSHKHLECI